MKRTIPLCVLTLLLTLIGGGCCHCHDRPGLFHRIAERRAQRHGGCCTDCCPELGCCRAAYP
jgi:hypothetical protein